MILVFLSCQLHTQKDSLDQMDSSSILDSAQALSAFYLAESTSSVVNSRYFSSTWVLSPEYPEAYPSLFESDTPSFYVLHPDPIPETAKVMWWFHGSAFGLDTTETPRGCTPDIVIPAAKRIVNSENVPAALLSHHDWIIVAPRNDWCDMWRGEGSEDISDPEHHFGARHFREVLNFVRSGGLGFTPSQEALWGTSMGGVGAMRAQLLHGGFSSLIMDSSPSSALLFYELEHGPNDQAALEHVFGGGPYLSDGTTSSFFEAYQLGSAEFLIQEGLLNLPIFAHFNTLDAVTPVNHPHAIREAIAEYGVTGSGVHDHNHPYPGQDAHVQTLGGPNLDQGYTASAMLYFSMGEQVQWIEAESLCPSCTAGQVINAAANPNLKSLSGGAGRLLSESENGTFWAQPIENTIHHIQPMLSRVSTSEAIRIQFFAADTPLQSIDLASNLFEESGLNSVLNGLIQSRIAVPADATRYTIELAPNSSAILDGVLTFQERP